MCGYQASCLQDGKCSTWKDNMLSMCSKQDFILITVLVLLAPILKVVRNLFQTFNLRVDRQFDMVQIINDCGQPKN